MSAAPAQPASSNRPVVAPIKPLPPGAWDTHAHIFGPFDAYPLLEPRRYSPPLAPIEDYLRMLDTAGFARGVLVHSSASGFDNSLELDALCVAGHRAFDIAVVPPSIKDNVLEDMHARGVRGIRFTINGGKSQLYPGSLDFNDLRAFAPRLKALGWQAHIWARCDYLVEHAAELMAYDIPVVIDHMGYFDATKGAQDATFRSFLSMLPDGDFWTKLTPIRILKTDPTHQTMRPFHEALVETVPDRLLFGSDWPYISLDAAPPTVGDLIDLFDAWTPDEGIRRKVFVDNPRMLFGEI